MPETTKPKPKHGSNAMLITRYFREERDDMPTMRKEYTDLSPEERQEMGDLIRLEIDAGRFSLKKLGA